VKQTFKKLASEFLQIVSGEQIYSAEYGQTSSIAQRQFFLSLSAIAEQGGGGGPSFRDSGFRVYSQADEDGLLLYIFSLIGLTNKLLIDMASGKPNGANSTNLIINWGFHALLLEGDDNKVRQSRAFYRRHPDTTLFPPCIVKAWITAENINALIRDNGFEGEIDLLSLDVDGVDYWLWDKLDAVSPRVVIVEYQDCFPADRAVTVPYSADFNRHDHSPEYFGASLAAFVKLAQRKGYRLVGCNRYGYNAFFVRNDIQSTLLPEIEATDCLTHPKVTKSRMEKLKLLEKFPWQEV